MIFTEQEVADRFRLHQFIHRLFTPCKKNKSDFINGIDAEMLYDIYNITYPHNVLSVTIVNNILLMGGFVETENEETYNCLHAVINKEIYEQLDKKIQLKILSVANEKAAITLRQLILGKITVEGVSKVNPELQMKLFYKIFTVNSTNRYYYQMTHKNRSTIKDQYEYYIFICNCFHLPIISKRCWLQELERLGVKRMKGYVDGRSGQIYFTNMFIPKTPEELQLTLDWGMCCIYNGRTHVTSMEELLENYSEGSKDIIFRQNLERMYIDEPIRKTIQKEKEKTNCWRTDQAKALFICTSEEKLKTKNNVGYTSGIQSEHKETETNYTEVESAEISRTSGFNTTEGNTTAATEYPSGVENAEGGEPTNDTGIEPSTEPNIEDPADSNNDEPENTEGDTGSIEDNTESGENTSDNSEPSLAEIATALKVPYKMMPNNFTKEVMAEWCKKMSVDINVDDYYEILIELMEE